MNEILDHWGLPVITSHSALSQRRQAIKVVSEWFGLELYTWEDIYILLTAPEGINMHESLARQIIDDFSRAPGLTPFDAAVLRDDEVKKQMYDSTGMALTVFSHFFIFLIINDTTHTCSAFRT